jgi:5-hydroxyisourate hydrolase/2-oxo-4-hydroxy-4-carboxy-5-ureidoimidazoline decarboxylase
MLLVLGHDDALSCCAAAQFAQRLAGGGPYGSIEDAVAAARRIWWHEVRATCRAAALPSSRARPPRRRIPHLQTDVPGWLEAFAAHPRIGDVEGLKRKFGAFGSHSNEEQAAALSDHNERVFQVPPRAWCGSSCRSRLVNAARDTADARALQELSNCNRQYEQRFGHIFIICASGKSAGELLQALQERCAAAWASGPPIVLHPRRRQQPMASRPPASREHHWARAPGPTPTAAPRRLPNPVHHELVNAAREQMKITEIRLRKVLEQQAAAAGAAVAAAAGGAVERAARRAGQLAGHLAPAAGQRAAQQQPARCCSATTDPGCRWRGPVAWQQAPTGSCGPERKAGQSAGQHAAAAAVEAMRAARHRRIEPALARPVWPRR